jgi:hypothetical protein
MTSNPTKELPRRSGHGDDVAANGTRTKYIRKAIELDSSKTRNLAIFHAANFAGSSLRHLASVIQKNKEFV